MITKAIKGGGITGAIRYIMGEGRDPKTGETIQRGANDNTRVAFIGGQGFGFAIDSPERVEIARAMMEWAALPEHQASRTRPCKEDCYHLVLNWHTSERPSREEMEEAAASALKAVGMENARAVWAAHSDKDHQHLHIVASKIDPTTGRAFDLYYDRVKLDAWALNWELEHGGVRCEARVAKQERDLSALLDPAKALAEITRQFSTFDRKDLDRLLFPVVKGREERAAFIDTVIAQAGVVGLREKGSAADAPPDRWTTQEVLDAEVGALSHASLMAADRKHGVRQTQIARVLHGLTIAGTPPREDQLRAIIHATKAEGLALIDGKAGTGKSFALSAVRQIYEAEGCRVIGLAPTNAVAADMKADGFKEGGTVHAALFALKNGRDSWNEKTVVVVDEAAMLSTRITAEIMEAASRTGAKVIFAGDDRQLGSMERGGLFGALRERHGGATLDEITRQRGDGDRRASHLLSEGQYRDALDHYEAAGRIKWADTEDQKLGQAVAAWARDSAADPKASRLVLAGSNREVMALNAAMRDVRKARGELGTAEDRAAWKQAQKTGADVPPPTEHVLQTKDGKAAFAVGDRVIFNETVKKAGLFNGQRSTVEKIEGAMLTVRLDGKDGKPGQLREIDTREFQGFRHGYASTVHKAQGQTVDAAYIVHSQQMRGRAAYVAMTRHRDSAQVFASRDAVRDLAAMARQMSRPDDRRSASQFDQVQPAQTRQAQPEAATRPQTAPEAAAAHVRRPGEAPRAGGERNPLDDLMRALKPDGEPEAKPAPDLPQQRRRGHDGPGF